MTGTEITGGEVAAEAEIGIAGTGTVARTKITIIEAGATVEAPSTAKMMVEEDMTMRGGVEVVAVLMEALLLVELALVLGEAPLPEHLLGVKALLCVHVRGDLQLQRAFHHAGGQQIPVVSLLVNLMEMSKCCACQRAL